MNCSYFRNLTTHMRDNHPKEGEDHWPCDDCDKVFQSKRYLNKHVQNCHKVHEKQVETGNSNF